MPTFEAKEKTPATEAQAPGAKVPEASQGGLDYLGAGRLYTYTHDRHDERDFLRPGYLDSIIDKGAQQYHGALIIYTMRCGKRDPEDWATGIVRIARVRGTRGLDAMAPTTLAVVTRFHKATLAAHDGTDKAA